MANQKISQFATADLPLDPGDELFVMQQGELRRVSFEDAYASFVPTKTITTPQQNNTTTPAEATELTMALRAGTYMIEGSIVYQSAGTGVGIQMYIDAGTPSAVSSCRATWYHSSTGGAAATGVADQLTTSGAQLIEGKSQYLIGQANGATQGVDTANQDMLAEMVVSLILTADTTIKLMFNASAGGTNVTLIEGSCLIPTWLQA